MKRQSEQTIKIERPLKLDDFEAVIVNALEGNSKKWAKVKAKDFLSQVPESNEFFLGPNERIAHALFMHPRQSLPVYHTKTGKQIGYVNKKSMKDALVMASLLYPEQWERFTLNEQTPEDMDIFFQLAALGEVKH